MRQFTEEHKALLREKAKARWADKEKRKEQAEKLKASWTSERREEFGAKQRGVLKTWSESYWTDERRKAFGESRSGENNPNFGKVRTEEERQRLREQNTGKAFNLKRYGISPEDYAKEIEAGNRWCHFGKHFVPVSEFHNGSGCCQSCKSKHYRKSDLKRSYKVDHEWYLEQLAKQGGGCAICGKTQGTKGDRHLAIDHNHKTGKIRAILCHRCNTAIERLETVENWGILAANYLSRYTN